MARHLTNPLASGIGGDIAMMRFLKKHEIPMRSALAKATSQAYASSEA
jgi:hypothetical protein